VSNVGLFNHCDTFQFATQRASAATILTQRALSLATDSPTVEFWRWFVANSSRFADDYDQPDLVTALDCRVQALNPKLSWEIGPGTSKQFQLVISPDLNPALRDISLQIVRLAPELADWEFYASRPPKQWSLRFQLDRDNGDGSAEIDAAAWTFVLQKAPSAKYDVLLVAEELQPLTEDERWTAAAIVIESILGEDLLLDTIDRFSIVGAVPPPLTSQNRSIRELKEAVLAGAPSESF
jgi:hypothetical protein